MRLLASFLGLVLLALAGVAAVNRTVDPFGFFYDGRALDTALASAPPCLVSVNYTGSGAPRASLSFKLDLLRRQPPRTAVLGTSPVFNVHAHPGERGFLNLGLPNAGVETIAPMLRELHRRNPGPKTVYLGVSAFWFNRTWQTPNPFALPPTLVGSLRSPDALFEHSLPQLLARENLRESVELLTDAPAEAVEGDARSGVGGRCVVQRSARVSGGTAEAWDAADGSMHSRWTLVPERRRASGDDLEKDLLTFDSGLYTDWRRLDAERVRLLDDALALARRYRFRVVGFAPPYASRYVERFETAPELRPRWREYGTVVPAAFRRHGFAYLDLRRGADVPCGDAEFDYGGDGWHPDRRCSQRIRRLLDAAAGRA